MICEFSVKTFDELTSVDLYHILKARSQVFVVEQDCAYQDMDEVDFDCLHLIAHQNEALVGYCRIIAPEFNLKRSLENPAHSMPAIGRVLVLEEHRGNGIARQLMMHAIKHCKKKYGKKPIVISAQSYLLGFYESLGFIAEGERYLEDDIEHVTMVLPELKKVKVKKQKQQKEKSGLAAKLFTFIMLILSLMFLAGLIYLMT